jgi:hypothetical protein
MTIRGLHPQALVEAGRRTFRGVAFRSSVFTRGGCRCISGVGREVTERRQAAREPAAQPDARRRFRMAGVDRELRMQERKDGNERLRKQLAAGSGGEP